MPVQRGPLLALLVVLSLIPSLTICETEQNSIEESFRTSERDKILRRFGLKYSQRKGLDRDAFIAKKYSAPEFMINLFHELENEVLEGDELYIDQTKAKGKYVTERRFLDEAKVDTIISFFKYVRDDSWKRSHRDIKIKFKAEFDSGIEHVQGGEFKLYKRRPRKQNVEDSLCTVNVYGIKPEEGKPVLLDTRVVRALKTGWLSFNVTSVVKEWARLPLSNRGLQLVVVNTSGEVVNPYHFGIVGERGNEKKRPYLVSFVKTTRGLPTFNQEILLSRERRSIREASGSPVTPCQLNKLYVDFEKIGLRNIIIAPDGYEARFCQGSCMYPWNKNSTRHAIIQSLAHLVHGNIPNPCCSPYTLKPLSILYYDEDKVAFKRHPEMIATSCLCQ